MCTGQFCHFSPPSTRLLIRRTFYFLDIEGCIQVSKFHYTAIKATERQTEETEELLKGLFDPEESRAIEREMNCKGVIYHKCNNYDECNNHNKHNEQ